MQKARNGAKAKSTCTRAPRSDGNRANPVLHLPSSELPDASQVPRASAPSCLGSFGWESSAVGVACSSCASCPGFCPHRPTPRL